MKQIVIDGPLVGPWVREKSGGVYAPGDPAIGLMVDGELVVGVTYDGFTGASVSIHSRCDDPLAPNRRFYWTIFDYPFNQLKVGRVWGLVSSKNEAAKKVDEHLGFKQVSVLEEYFPEGDAIIYVMKRADCRWLALGEKYAPRPT